MQVSQDSGRSGTHTTIHGYPETRTIWGSFQPPFANPAILFFFSRRTGVHQLSKIVEMGVFFEKGRLYQESTLLFSSV
jgi:hypothetical protein